MNTNVRKSQSQSKSKKVTCFYMTYWAVFIYAEPVLRKYTLGEEHKSEDFKKFIKIRYFHLFVTRHRIWIGNWIY
jgi:hypothetical protein